MAELQKSIPLIRPVSIALVAVSSPNHYTLWNSLAAESLAGDLRGVFADRVEVSVFRARSGSELDAIAQRLQREKPDVVGISVECGGVDLSFQFADRLARWNGNGASSSPRLLFGGKIPTYFPELFLHRYSSAIVVMGEGELPLRRLVGHWLGRVAEPLLSVPNLAICNRDMQVQRTSTQLPSCSELTHPPSLDTVQELVAAGAGTLLTQASRGCSWSKCTYCTVPSFRFREKWEPLPWSRTLQHLERLASLGVREFEFCDDEFMGGRDQEHLDRVSGIAEALKALGKNCDRGIAFRVFLIPHTIYRDTDPAGNFAVRRALEQLKDAGLVRVYFGVESGSQSQLKRYCRGLPLADVIGALEVVKALGLGIDCGFIMFDPFATVEDIAENVNFFRKHGLIEYNQWPFRPLVANEGSGFGRIMARRGITPDPEYMCYRYAFNDPHVQLIFDTVNALSSETRSLFYALKVISKTHFDPKRESLESKRARELVIENGLIYLDLIEDLLDEIAAGRSNQLISNAVSRAHDRVRNLVIEVAKDLDRGLFRDPHGRLRSEVAQHLPTTHSFSNPSRSVSPTDARDGWVKRWPNT